MVRKSRQYKGGYDDNSDGVLNTSSTAKQGLTHHLGKLVSAAHGVVKSFLFNPKEDEERPTSTMVSVPSTSQSQLGGKRKRKTKGRKSHKKKTRKYTKSKRHSRRRRR